MKLKRLFAVTLLSSLFTLLISSVSMAAALGIVDYSYLEQHHRNYARDMRVYDSYVRSYRVEFDQKYAKKPEAEREKMVKFYNDKLSEFKEGVMSKIRTDILAQIKIVEKEKGLSNVAVKGYVLDGTYVDITNDVLQKIK